MGNDLSSEGERKHQHHHRHLLSHEERVQLFKESQEWAYIETHLIQPLLETVSTEESKLAVLAMLSRGRRGILDYAALYSVMPPAHVIRALMIAHESILLESDYANLIFGSPIASVGDFMAVAASDEFDLDARLHKKLSLVFDNFNKNPILNFFEAKLLSYPSVNQGFEELQHFHERHLEGKVIGADWTVADTILLVFVVKSSIHWQVRLHRIFGHRLTQDIIVSIAKEQLQNNNPQNASDAAIRLMTLRALDVCV